MFRFSLIASVLLIFGVAAKPWNTLENEALEEKYVFIDEKGKLSWDVEVEPPEDMDGIQYEIDPDMKIGKKMKAEEDLDELHHPSTVDLHDQIQETDRVAEVPPNPPKNDANRKYRLEAEEDRDEIDHPSFSEEDEEYNKARQELAQYLAPLMSGYKAEAAEDQPSFVQMDVMNSERAGRIHLQPEEDLDDLYHKDVLIPEVQQVDAEAAAPANYLPSQRKYSEPEEDLDDLYHK